MSKERSRVRRLVEVEKDRKMEIVVETKNEIFGDGVFWRGPAERVGEIRNIPARETAKLVAKDGNPRVCGMWHVSALGTKG